MPILISVPHAGLQVPEEVRDVNILSLQDVIRDGDEGAAEIYDIGSEVEFLVTSEVARAYVDFNRPEDDRRADGVVKTHTCWQVPIYNRPLSEETIQSLLARYYRPYHHSLSKFAGKTMLGIDCHTMAAVGPPIGPGAGAERPLICISNAKGTCSDSWLRLMAECLESTFDTQVKINDPFKGGFIIRSHSIEMPWLQLEISRAPFMDNTEKRTRLLEAFHRWCIRAKE